MSSRVLRRLREEKEAARTAALLSAADEEVDGDDNEDGGGGEERNGSDEDEEEGDERVDVGGRGGFMSMLMDGESSCSEGEDDESLSGGGDDEEVGEEGRDKAGGDAKPAGATVTSFGQFKNRGGNPRLKNQQSRNSNKARNVDDDDDEEEEDLDAILFDMNIHSDQKEHVAARGSGDGGGHTTSIRVLLLSKETGFDVQDLDLDHAMRSLVGVAGVVAAAAAGAGAGAGAGGNAAMGGGFGGQQQQQHRGRGGRNNRRYAPAKKFLFGRARPEWGKPPSFVGGGIGAREDTAEALREERRPWSVPWPYNDSIVGDVVDADADDATATPPAAPTIIPSNQRWFTLQMSDTYQEHNYIYQDLLSSSSSASSSSRQDGGGAGLHDPNLLAMFVTDHPHFVETVLQLAMVMYVVNDRARGHDLLRRCVFLYESALPSSVLPGGYASSGGGDGREVLIDVDRNQLNAGYFAALFRVMQTSGMSGWYDNALATGRYLLSLDPQRDPMGVLLILDYYALASRRRHRRTCMPSSCNDGRSAVATTTTREVEVGAAFIVDLIESNLIFINHTDPLTGRHLSCRLVDMPNWAFSYALALYRLYEDGQSDDDDTLDVEEEDPHRGRAAADDAVVHALSRFPGVLYKLLVAMNIVENISPGRYSFRSGSSSLDWSTVLPAFNDSARIDKDSREDHVAGGKGENLTNIFVKRCHNLWKEESVVRWLYHCAERSAMGEFRCIKGKLRSIFGDDLDEEEDGKSLLPPQQDDSAAAITSDVANGKSALPSRRPRVMSSFLPALARYAQCDPSEYEDSFRTFPPEAIGLDPNILAPAMVALGPNNGGRRRFFRQGQQQPQHRIIDAGERGAGGRDPLDILRQMLPEVEIVDPDSPLLQLYLQSLLPWAHVEGVRPPPRG